MSKPSATSKVLAKLTVAELKEELAGRGLDISGKKNELVERLKKYNEDQNEKEEEQNNETEGVKGEVEEEAKDKSIKVENQALDHETDEADDNGSIKKEVKSTEPEEGECVPDEDDPDNFDEVVDIERMGECINDTANEASNSKDEDKHVEVKTEIPEDMEVNEKEADGKEVKKESSEHKEEIKEEKIEIKDELKSEETKMETDTKKEKEHRTDGVVIESVGEVDDEEFVAAVANFEDDEETEAAKKEKKEKKIKDMRELPSKPMHDWVLKQFSIARNFSSLYIKQLSAIDVLSDIMFEWASRAIFFCINSERDGKGAAVLHFVTEKECKEAKEALTSNLGGEVKIVHPSRHQESDMRKRLSYQIDYPNLASRTLLVEGAPDDTSEDQICLLFNGAISVSRLVGDHYVNWQGEDYKLPENIGNVFFVEFGTTKDLKDATADGKEYEIAEQKLTVNSTDAYYKNYRDEESKRREEARKKRREQEEKERKEKLERIKTKVISDEERIEKSKQLHDLEKERSDVLTNKTMSYADKTQQKKKLGNDIIAIVKVLEKDTEYREQLDMALPEPEYQMTAKIKSMWRKMPVYKKKMASLKEEEKQKHDKSKPDKDHKGEERNKPEEKKTDENKDKKAEPNRKPDDKKPDDKIPADNKIQDRNLDERKTDRRPDDRKDKDKHSHHSSSKSSTHHHRHRSRSPVKRGEGSGPTSRSPRRTRSSPKKEKSWDFAVRTTALTDRDRQDIRRELDKMEEDTRGWWHLLIHKPNNPDFKEKDCEKLCSKYGRVMQVHFTNQKIFVRFNSRSAVSAAIRDLWGSKLKIEVPHINDKYKMKNLRPQPDKLSQSSNSNRMDDRRGRDNERRGGRERSPQTDNPLAIMAMKQQAQQQMLLQQQLEEQQQQQHLQQASMYMQAAVSAMQQKPQTQSYISDPAVIQSMPALQQTTHMGGVVPINYPLAGTSTSVPGMFGASGVAPPTSSYSSRDSRSQGQQSRQRDHDAHDRGRTPEKRQYDRNSSRSRLSPERKGYSSLKDTYSYKPEPKRSRFDEPKIERPSGSSYDYNSTSRDVRSQITQSEQNRGGSGDMNDLQDLTKTLSSQMEQLSRLTSDPSQANAIKGVLTNLQGILPGTAAAVGSSSSRSAPLLNQPTQTPISYAVQRHSNRAVTSSTGDGLLPAPTARMATTSMQLQSANPTVQHLEHPSLLAAPPVARISVQSGSMQVGIGGAPAAGTAGLVYPMAGSVGVGGITEMQAAGRLPYTSVHQQQQAAIKAPLLTNPPLRYQDDRVHAFRQGRL